MRIIGLDIGSKSCGIAITDELKITAQPIENYRFEEEDWGMLLKRIDELFVQYEIETIVVGYPKLPSGDKSQTTLMIDEVIKLLEQSFDVPIIKQDEYKTTKAANEVMIDAGMSRKKRKTVKDQLAAQIILSKYLGNIY